MSSRNVSVVVTGCGAGIGEATLRCLLQAGYYVVGIEREPALGRRAETLLNDRGRVLIGDVKDRNLLSQAATHARKAAPLHGWVNNAAIEALGALHELEPPGLEAQLAVDLLAFIWGSQVAVRTFMDQRSAGSIVNVSSVHGRRGYPDWATYDIAKGGIDALTRYIAVEYGPAGIRANGVAPGSVRTQMHKRFVDATPDPAATEHDMAGVIPLRRIADPDEIGKVITFLLSDSASYLTGQTIAVDGGTSVAGGVFQPHEDLLARYASLSRQPAREDA